MPQRRRLATGIYADAHGLSVIVSHHGTPQEHRFDPGTPLERLVRWRARKVGELADTDPAPARGTLARDVVTFLKTRKGLANYKTEKTNLKAWIAALGNVHRWKITPQAIETTIATWRAAGYSKQTLRHRFRILRQVYRTLDGRRARTPFDDLSMPEKPRPRPVAPADDVIAAVAAQLRKQEILRRQDGKTRARFLVEATTGRRPAEVKRARVEDVDFARRLWYTRGAKGGRHTVIVLNEEQLAAWHLFAAARAWGAFDTRSFTATLQRAGWPKGMRVYNVRHAVAYAIRARGGDARDVQDQLGHTTLETGAHYFDQDPARAAAVSAALDGRLGTAAFLPRPIPTNRPGKPAKGRVLSGKFATEPDGAGQGRSRSRGRKTA
jgi:integrase